MGFFRLVIIAALIYLFYRLVKGIFTSIGEGSRRRPNGVIDEMVQDPQCKTYLPRKEAYKKVIKGREYYFCSRECAERFENEHK